ncbi:MAG: nuclear transport factor 2 family protein [Pseudomonadota bacterium]
MDANDLPSSHVGAQILMQRLKTFYEKFTVESIGQINSVYTQDVEFRDPVHLVNGSLALKHYLRGMAGSLRHYSIRYLDEQIGDQTAYFTWELDYSHGAVKRGEMITVRGMTHVKFTAKVFYHEDSYDMGALLYDHLPVLGAATRGLRKRMAGTH